MLKYTIKRLLESLVTVLIIVTIVFLLLRLLPTDYYFTEEQLMKFTEEQKQEQLLAAGLLDPIPEQLMDFYGDVIRLDFGESRRIQNGVPVVKVIGDKFQISMRMGIISIGISMVVGVLIGIIQTRYKDKVPDHIGTVYTIFVNSVPIAGILLVGTDFRFACAGSAFDVLDQKPGSIEHPANRMSVYGSIAWYALWTRTLYDRRAEQRLHQAGTC